MMMQRCVLMLMYEVTKCGCICGCGYWCGYGCGQKKCLHMSAKKYFYLSILIYKLCKITLSFQDYFKTPNSVSLV